MDNLSAHKVSGIETAIAAAAAALIYLPSYSPDWSPIEPCWSAIKTRLRGVKARTREALDRALTKIVNSVSNRDARGWFTHCGFALH
jgi:transposase